MDTLGLIRRHVKETLAVGWGAVDDQTPLFSSGAVDSLNKMKLILFLERTFGVVIEAEDVASGKLETISAMAECVLSKKQAS